MTQHDQHDQQDQQDQQDPEILDAYRRMSTSLAAPGDPLPGVQRAIRRRRVVRRGVAGIAALAVVGVVGGGLALRGGSDGSDDLAAVDEPTATPTPVPTGPASTLSYQRADGTTYTFDVAGLALSCERVDGVQTMQLRTAEPAFDKKSDALLEPLLSVEVVPERVTPGQVLTMPVESDSGSSEDRPLTDRKSVV